MATALKPLTFGFYLLWLGDISGTNAVVCPNSPRYWIRPIKWVCGDVLTHDQLQYR